LTGRLVASATYAKGKKKNKDSDAKADFNNSAGDLVVTPVAGLAFFLRYRHYELDLDNPDIGKITGAGQSAPWTVRDSISSKKDVMTGAVRYRLTERLTVKGEYAVEAIKRNVEGINSNGYPTQALGELVAAHTVKSTEKLGLTYRVMSKLSLRADYTAVQIENPAYADDPDRIGSAKTTITWTPSRRIIAVASYGGVRENRDKLTAPLAGGSRKTDRQQGLGSLTFVVGKRSSLTASYMNYQNLAKEILTRRDSSGSLFLEDSVPYADRAKVYSLSATQAMSDNVRLVLEASESLSRGNFKTGGELAGIDSYSDMRVVEDIYTAGLEIQHSETISGELRYQQRHYDDRIDNTQDGKVSIIMATMAVKW
jgi:hypothetical protein